MDLPGASLDPHLASSDQQRGHHQGGSRHREDRPGAASSGEKLTERWAWIYNLVGKGRFLGQSFNFWCQKQCILIASMIKEGFHEWTNIYPWTHGVAVSLATGKYVYFTPQQASVRSSAKVFSIGWTFSARLAWEFRNLITFPDASYGPACHSSPQIIAMGQPICLAIRESWPVQVTEETLTGSRSVKDPKTTPYTI